MRLPRSWLLPTVALLTACSGIPLNAHQEALRARYDAYAGAPVKQFTWIGRYDSWDPIGTNQLVVWTTPYQAYLIKVAPPCDNLQFVHRIELTSTANTVYAGFDAVKVEHGWRCPIQEIRPVDYRRMQQDMRKESASAAEKG